MKFRTAINIDEIQKPEQAINYSDRIFLTGSCFVENIGEKLEYYRFNNLINPHGILFNPVSIQRSILDIAYQKEYTEDDLFFHEESWRSFHHHSAFSDRDKFKALYNINNSLSKAYVFLQLANLVVITLGTAWVYRLKETDEIVGNCHKVPKDKFKKELLTFEQIKMSLKKSVKSLRKLNSKVQILITISPVLHLKDGMINAANSKALLLGAVQEVVKEQNLCYFPSYEIQMHDLRDYRFYASDMLHPNQTAVDYIWETFSSIWIDKEEAFTMKKVEKIQKALAHKVFNDNADSYKLFMKKIDLLKKDLSKKKGIYF